MPTFAILAIEKRNSLLPAFSFTKHEEHEDKAKAKKFPASIIFSAKP